MAPRDNNSNISSSQEAAVVDEPRFSLTTEDRRCTEPPPSGRGLPSSSSNVSNAPNTITATTIISPAPPPISRNIRLTLIYTWFYFAGRSLWNQNVLATFVFMLRDGNPEAVGYITAVMGLSQMLVAFPAGFLADRYRRDTLLKVGSGTGCTAIVATLVAIQYSSYQYLVVALALWGITGGINNTSLLALYADSVPENGLPRSHYFTQRSIVTTLGTVTGPIVGIGMFFYLGDKWTIRDCAVVMGVGQAISFPAMMLLCWFTDHHDTTTASGVENPSLHEPLLAEEEEESDETRVDDDSSLNTPSVELVTGNHPPPNQLLLPSSSLLSSICVCCRCIIPENRMVPALIALADVISGFASGMSIRYFAIFLYHNLMMNPVAVQSLYVGAPLLQATLLKVAQQLSKEYGRCHVAVTFKWIGITLMIGMVLAYSQGLPTWVICTLLVTRTGFMNATGALTRSVLMDAVPKQERGKWSALESFNMFSWSGSAAIGGYLVGHEGILFNFCTTACLQFIATLPLVILFAVDHIEIGHTATAEEEEEAPIPSLEGNEEQEEEQDEESP